MQNSTNPLKPDSCASRLISIEDTVLRLSLASPISPTFAISSTELPSGVCRFAFEAAVGVSRRSGTVPPCCRGECIEDCDDVFNSPSSPS